MQEGEMKLTRGIQPSKGQLGKTKNKKNRMQHNATGSVQLGANYGMESKCWQRFGEKLDFFKLLSTVFCKHSVNFRQGNSVCAHVSLR